MQSQSKNTLPFFTLLLMISFASVNAVLFTPGLPAIAKHFNITTDIAQLTISWFLIGYACGQLLYGPIANRFGRKPALFYGISLQILSSVLCALSAPLDAYWLLVLGRFTLALGSGVGLKMTFTLVHESYDPKIAGQKTAYLMLAFAIAPGLSVALGGVLTTYYGWASCFYTGALYGLLLFLLVTKLPETQTTLDMNALKIKNLLHDYSRQFSNSILVLGGLLMGGVTCFVYVFAAVAPFVAMNLLGMSSVEYGNANIIPIIGLVAGSLFTAQFVKKYPPQTAIKLGIIVSSIASLIMLAMVLSHQPPLLSLFIPLLLTYLGLSLVFSNASTLAMAHTTDKAHGAAVMSFINMGVVTLLVLSLGWLPTTPLILPSIFIGVCLCMMALYKILIRFI